jgi:glycine dehydrogenase
MPNYSEPSNSFVARHIGPSSDEVTVMLLELGYKNIDEFIRAVIPEKILTKKPLQVGEPLSEASVLAELKAIASQNQIFKSYIGMGYSDCLTPSVILRNVLENPGWYTQYTPYQAEIAQGRLQALLNFQTMVCDLTGLPISNASLLDEATAAAEAMAVCLNTKGHENTKAFFVSEKCHPQTIEVIKTRARPIGIEILLGDHLKFDFEKVKVAGALIQYPATDGTIFDYKNFIEKAHQSKALVVMACDILALTLLTSPGELGADIAIGSTQRFGVPLGYGGPHAAFFATKDEYKRLIPGRLVGVSIDAENKPALRLALQTREQHIRRGKATSNICTAQVLLAIMASMYAVYHGPKGLRAIAERVHLQTVVLAKGLLKLGYKVSEKNYFDTIFVSMKDKQLETVLLEASARRINLRALDGETLGIALDETTTPADIMNLLYAFAGSEKVSFALSELSAENVLPQELKRKSDYLSHPVFNSYHSETEMLRYITRLQSKDLSLAVSMIPLGSCTMKLNATTEMLPVSWPEFSKLHPFAPLDQATGYKILTDRLEDMLSDITGFDAVSLQPNAGSQGEYAGLLAIHKYHEVRGEAHRDVCLIPASAHGTNPASAAMAGLKIVAVECDENGNVALSDLKAKAELHAKNLSSLMITYPSTHGVFEEGITEICDVIHKFGGQVYMDGANMNAQVGYCRPAEFGADVCHLNLHKTFCIPHGGGGPGVGPIGVKAHLKPYLPGNSVMGLGGDHSVGAVSAAPWGSASILPISYSYIRMMGTEGLKQATAVAILNANYMAKRLDRYYPVLYKGANGLVAHECILDLRRMKTETDVSVVDVAKRLMDYGFHAPTISWPVPGTMMVEPTESESKAELDRFCDAMIAIHGEISEIASGKADRENNLLKRAPHTAAVIASDNWDRPYSRKRAAFPIERLNDFKFWPAVSRINDPHGDKNLVCACPPVESYDQAGATPTPRST